MSGKILQRTTDILKGSGSKNRNCRSRDGNIQCCESPAYNKNYCTNVSLIQGPKPGSSTQTLITDWLLILYNCSFGTFRFSHFHLLTIVIDVLTLQRPRSFPLLCCVSDFPLVTSLYSLHSTNPAHMRRISPVRRPRATSYVRAEKALLSPHRSGRTDSLCDHRSL